MIPKPRKLLQLAPATRCVRECQSSDSITLHRLLRLRLQLGIYKRPVAKIRGAHIWRIHDRPHCVAYPALCRCADSWTIAMATEEQARPPTVLPLSFAVWRQSYDTLSQLLTCALLRDGS
jgi:hypothetical protein